MALIDRFWPRKKPAPQPRISPRNIAVISATRNFEAAIADRLTASWKSPSQTANEEIAAGRLQAIKSPYRIRDDWRQDWEDARKTAQVVTPQQFIRPRKYIPKHLIAR